MNRIILPACLALFAPSLLAADLFVPGGHPTIQGAILAASSGDTVHVAAGTWVEALDFLGKDIRVVATDGATATELRAPALAGSVVTFQSGEGPGATLEGFHVTENHNADFLPLIHIAGASPTLLSLELTGMDATAISATDGDPTITSCAIHNAGVPSGRGIELRRSDAIIRFCSIHDLWLEAIFSTQSSSPVVERSAVYDCLQAFNISTDLLPTAGDTSHPVISHCVFARNGWNALYSPAIEVGASLSVTATDSLFLDHTELVLHAQGSPATSADEVLFERNQVFASQSSILPTLLLKNLGKVVLRNNVFALDPTTMPLGGALSVLNNQSTTLESNTVSSFGHVASVSASAASLPIFQGGLFAYQSDAVAFFGLAPEFAAATNLGGAGTSVVMITAPGFVDRAARDLHLRASSVAVNGGAHSSAAIDLEGDPRTPPPDYGADELQPASLWVSGTPLSGGAMRLVVQGPPGAPVFLGIATSLLPTPLPTLVGDLEIGPAFTLLPLGPLAPDGLLQIPFNAPITATPIALFGQALVGLQLTKAKEFVLGG